MIPAFMWLAIAGSTTRPRSYPDVAVALPLVQFRLDPLCWPVCKDHCHIMCLSVSMDMNISAVAISFA